MPTQEVARAVRLSALLRHGTGRPHRVLFGPAAPDAWRDGTARYSDTPVATLTIAPSGWACWTIDGVSRWRWGEPFAQWEAFVTACAPRVAAGGIATVLAYDLKHAVERLPRRLPWPRTPLLFAAAYDWSCTLTADGAGVRLAAPDPARLAAAARWLATAPDAAAPPPALPAVTLAPVIARDAYLAMVARAHDYLAAGDIYQVNLAQPFRAALPRAAAPALVAAWSERFPMPFAAYVEGADWTLVANSPECFLELDGARIATFPIKGTRRGAAGGGLAADAKERAEHVMIVDLERNDLGRVCVPGSIAVEGLFAERTYPLLAHMESAVHGRLRPGTGLAAVLRALFPGGSISGAPKVRALEIIEELEPAPRGFYTGAIGWTVPGGRTVFNIAIRTAVLDRDGLCYWAGGGIVADSVAEREYAETLLKAEALVRALGGRERSGT